MISRKLLSVVTIIWLCTEIGQFVELRTSMGSNSLFWPFWICLTLVVVLGTHMLDTYFEKHKAKASAQENAPSNSQSGHG